MLQGNIKSVYHYLADEPQRPGVCTPPQWKAWALQPAMKSSLHSPKSEKARAQQQWPSTAKIKFPLKKKKKKEKLPLCWILV